MSNASSESSRSTAEKSLSAPTMRRPGTGAELAIEEFVRKNYLDVYRYLYHRVPHVLDAQDMCQETFLRYLKQVEAAELGLKGRAYLFTIARNISVDFYRTRQLAPQAITPELEETLPDRSTSEELATDDFDTLVASLDEDLQEILSLRYAQGFGINEIADITNTSRFAVRRKIKRALSLLKDSWKETEHAG